MATNKRKDSTALFELIDKSTLKVPKNGGSLKIPSWWSSKNNPPSLSQPHGGAGGAGGRNSVQPAAFQKPVPQAPASTSGAAPHMAPAPASPQSRMFEPPLADGSGGASPSIRPPVPPSGPRFAMVTAASKTEGAERAEEPVHEETGAGEPVEVIEEEGAATAVIEKREGPQQDAMRDSAATDSPDSYAGLGTGRRIFAPQTMSQTDGIHRDWMSQQKARLARSPMWAMVAGVSAVIIFLVLVVYTIMPHHAAGNPMGGGVAANSGGSNGPKVGVTGGGGSLLPPSGHTAPAPTPAGEHHDLLNNPAPQAAQGRVYEPGTAPRSADLYYIKIATTSVESIARRNADFLAKHGVDVSLETQMSRTHHLLYILISVQGFPTMSEARELRTKIVDIGHLPPYFSSGHPAWDDAPVLRWSSLTGSRR